MMLHFRTNIENNLRYDRGGDEEKEENKCCVVPGIFSRNLVCGKRKEVCALDLEILGLGSRVTF